MTGTVLIVTHFEGTDLEWIHNLVQARGLQSQVVHPFAGDDLPELGSLAAVISLGGPQSAYDGARHPFLVDERTFLARAVEQQVPVLGICLGSQILALALGGTVVPGSQGLECGLIDVRLAPGNHTLPEVTGRFFSFHSDSFIPPVGAELLAVSDRYPQAWRFGSALAIQFHPEISPTGIQTLLTVEAAKLTANGVDLAELLSAAIRDEGRAWTSARRVIGGWIDTAVLAGERQTIP
ncbi:type 1 glutamine amidotransferase [Cryobacterium sp. PH31-O1]|uniref:type 1 glutamine amidotransferase n=1 Tax=Cryobacterium sp. PH31-O1 TaxID=3046306 RepID=UPI0024BBDA20|nr:type 1 glutamine amidotransferase [Cryobacterium sp. PH31-O1]MDJ0339663.1 type 1 glutamine amidotransferase [Cryobacterium sp. PH31-O1]